MAYLIFKKDLSTDIEFLENQISTLLFLRKCDIKSHYSIELIHNIDLHKASDLSLIAYVLHAEIDSLRFYLIEINIELSTDVYLNPLNELYIGYLQNLPEKPSLINRAQIIKKIEDAGNTISHKEMESLGIKENVLNSINDYDFFAKIDSETKRILHDFLKQKSRAAAENSPKLKRLLQKNF